MKVKDLMTTELFTLRSDHTMDLAEDMMSWQNIRHIPVVNRKFELVGLITHRDLLRTSLSNLSRVTLNEQRKLLSHIKVSDIMKKKIATIAPTADLREAAAMMIDNKIGCLPVVEAKQLVGILTEADFLTLAWESMATRKYTKAAR